MNFVREKNCGPAGTGTIVFFLTTVVSLINCYLTLTTMLFLLSIIRVSAKTDEVTCPYGFNLAGDICKKWNEVPLVPYCEKGVLENDKCVLRASAKPKCLSGDYYNNMCRSSQLASPIMQCPTGFSLRVQGKETNCTRPVSYNQKAPCPHGTVESGKGCISYSYSAPELWCPPDLQLHGEWCKKTVSYDCSPQSKGVPIVFATKKHGGKKKHGKKHGGHHHRLLGAKKSVSYVGKDKPIVTTKVVQQLCEKMIKSPVVKKCPAGSSSTGKECKIVHHHERGVIEKITHEQSPANAVCPHGYDWCQSGKHGHKHHKNSVNTCCMHSTEEPIWECPHGYHQDRFDCIQTFTPSHICHSNTGKKHNKHGSDCSGWEYADPIRKISVVVSTNSKKKHHKHH
eukprot:GHVH01007766.1.p1 GENE.GHVH01007766.1~~GHVH01007766.1.p1  ORF type:complete len:397 (+),score=23.45 GHVH01007766.1:150-1340(+)